jgi:hypothetical protein
VNTEQCTSGLSGTSISGTCGVYGTSCKTKCEVLTDEIPETCSSRPTDCFGVMDENGAFKKCIDRVC